jgi:hypothetical protein
MWIIEDDMAICLICRESLNIQDVPRDDYSNAMENHVEIHDKQNDLGVHNV